MTIRQSFQDFLKSEDGAVTVDWVVLTAAVVGLGLAAVTAVAPGAWDLAGDIGTDLSNTNTGTGSGG